MKSVPGYPGHAWEVVASNAAGHPVKIRFARLRTGAPDTLLRKHDRLREDHTAPWFLRYSTGGKDVWRRVSADAPAPWLPDGIVAAIRNALDALTLAAQARDPYAAARAAAAYRARLTLATLAEEWRTLGMPGTAGNPRLPAQQARLVPFLETALTWWGPRDPAGVTQRGMRDYHTHRTATTTRGGCSRSVDLELVAMSNLCSWAVSDERIGANPFAQRPRFRASASVAHSSERMPPTDEALHAIIGWLFDASPAYQVAGASLMLQALTGLRPGEPSALRHNARALPRENEPGHISTRPDGRRLLAVRRTKSGINPGVLIHPALDDFLAHWLPHAAATWPGSPWWFPDPKDPTKPLIEFGDSHQSPILLHAIRDAAAATGHTHCAPHGMRAFFTRVCLSQGDDFGTVAAKLGQRSGAALVARAYSHLSNVIGDGRFDWLPEGSLVAWARFKANEATTVIAPQFRTA